MTGRLAPRAVPALAVVAVAAGLALMERRRTRLAERLDPPRGRFLHVGGARLHYVDRPGRGDVANPPAVLLHGNGGMAVEMELSGLVEAAAAGRRVLALDRPGYGYSTRPGRTPWDPFRQARQLREAFDALRLERPVVVGHSWGTLVALALAIEHGERVGGLLLLAGYHFPSGIERVGRFIPSRLPLVGPALAWTLLPAAVRAGLRPLLRWIFAPQAVPRRFAARFPFDLALRPVSLAASAAETALAVRAAARIASRLDRVRVPVAIMAGDADRVIDPHNHSARLHRALPGSEFRLLPGIGHMVHHVAPGEVAAAIGRVAGRIRA